MFSNYQYYIKARTLFYRLINICNGYFLTDFIMQIIITINSAYYSNFIILCYILFTIFTILFKRTELKCRFIVDIINAIFYRIIICRFLVGQVSNWTDFASMAHAWLSHLNRDTLTLQVHHQPSSFRSLF